jgi:predicted enzyme related to lactoylglutathione lyase
VPHWHLTFAVADRDEIVASALRLGATDLSGPIDNAWTKSAVVRDPQGATFTLSKFDPQTP